MEMAPASSTTIPSNGGIVYQLIKLKNSQLNMVGLSDKLIAVTAHIFLLTSKSFVLQSETDETQVEADVHHERPSC